MLSDRELYGGATDAELREIRSWYSSGDWPIIEARLIREIMRLRARDRITYMEPRVAEWVKTRVGPNHMNRRERAMRLLEEAIELAQAEGLTVEQVTAQTAHVFARPAGEPAQEAAGVAVTLLGWCAATGNRMLDLALSEIERIEAKPLEQIQGSVARKGDAGLVTCRGGTKSVLK